MSIRYVLYKTKVIKYKVQHSFDEMFLNKILTINAYETILQPQIKTIDFSITEYVKFKT